MEETSHQLAKQKDWEWLNYYYILPGPDWKPRLVLKITWVLKLKQLPNSSTINYKDLYCVHVELQISCIG